MIVTKGFSVEHPLEAGGIGRLELVQIATIRIRMARYGDKIEVCFRIWYQASG